MEPVAKQTGAWGWSRADWALVGLWLAVLAVLTGTTLLRGGTDDATLGAVARHAARSGLLVFALAFSAAALEQLFGGAIPRRLLAHRSQLGFAFGLSHLLFLGTNVTRVFVHYGGDFFALRPPIAWAAGGTIYLFIVAMMITSFPAPALRLGRLRWKVLHTIGGWSILLTFLNSYGQRALTRPAYLPWAAVAVAVLAVRGAAAWKQCPARCAAVIAACRRRCFGG